MEDEESETVIITPLEAKMMHGYMEIGMAVVDQLLYHAAHYMDAGVYKGHYRYVSSLFLTKEQKTFLEEVRREEFRVKEEKASSDTPPSTN